MQLLYVIHQYFPECHSGTEQYCLAISREARRRGDTVAVLSLEPIYDRRDEPVLLFEKPYDGFRVLRLRLWSELLPNGELRDYDNPLAAVYFRKVLDDVQPDALHFFHLRNLGSNLLEVAHERGIRSLVHLMDFWYLCPRFTLQKSDGSLCEGPPDEGRGCIPCASPDLAAEPGTPPLPVPAGFPPPDASAPSRAAALVARKDILLRRLALADVALAPSRFLAGMFTANGLEHRHLEVMPYGLEPDRVQRIDVQRPRQPLRVGFAGVFSPWKGAHVLVDAVRGSRAAMRLTLHGRTEEGMFQGYIDDLMQRAAGDPRIAFPGPYGHGELSQVLADLDLLVVPSLWYENTPFVVLEAFAAGLPVLVSDLGGMVELVQEGVNGWSFPAGDSAALRGILESIVADPDHLASLRPSRGASIADNYDRLRDLYRSPSNSSP